MSVKCTDIELATRVQYFIRRILLCFKKFVSKKQE